MAADIESLILEHFRSIRADIAKLKRETVSTNVQLAAMGQQLSHPASDFALKPTIIAFSISIVRIPISAYFSSQFCGLLATKTMPIRPNSLYLQIRII